MVLGGVSIEGIGEMEVFGFDEKSLLDLIVLDDFIEGLFEKEMMFIDKFWFNLVELELFFVNFMVLVVFFVMALYDSFHVLIILMEREFGEFDYF